MDIYPTSPLSPVSTGGDMGADVAAMAAQVRALEQKVAEQQVELEWLWGRNGRAHELLETVRNGLYKEVVELRQKSTQRTARADGRGYEDEMSSFFDISLDKLRALGSRDVYGGASRAHELEMLKAKQKAKANKAHVFAPRRPDGAPGGRGSAEGEERLRQIITLKETEARKLRQRLEMINTEMIRNTLDDARHELFELRESCYSIRHYIHAYRKWLQQNSIIKLVNQAVAEQNSMVTILSGQLPVVTRMINTLFAQVTKILQAPAHVFVAVENPWWESECVALSAEWTSTVPFKFEGCEKMFKEETGNCMKIYRLVAWLMGELKTTKETSMRQAAEIESHLQTIKELKAEREFMQQQHEMLKATIEELANERSRKKKMRRSRKSLASRSSRGSRSESIFSGVGSRSSIASRRHRSPNKRKSRKSLGFQKRQSRVQRQSVAGSAYDDDDSSSSGGSSRSGAASVASGRSRGGRRSRSRSRSRVGRSRSRSRAKPRDNDDSGTEVDDQKSRVSSRSRVSSLKEDEEDDIDSITSIEYGFIDDFLIATGRRTCGRYFVQWCRAFHKRYTAKRMERMHAETLEEATLQNERAAALTSLDRARQHNAAYKARERIARVAIPMHIPMPLAEARPRPARPVSANLRQRPLPQRDPRVPDVHVDRGAGGDLQAIPDLEWIKTWRQSAHPGRDLSREL